LWVGVRVACGIFNVVLGVLLLASLRWLGPLAWLAALPLAGAVLIFWTVYRLQQVQRVRLAGQTPVPGQESGESDSLGVGEDRLDRGERSGWGSCGHRGTSRPG
jgi:hypothetical protein